MTCYFRYLLCLIIFKVLMTYLMWCEEQKIWKFGQGKHQNSLSHMKISFQQKNIKLLLLNSFKLWWFCCSVSQWCPTLCNPMDCNMPAFPVLHHLPEIAQPQVHWVSDAMQPSHPLSSPYPAFNRSQHQGLFQWVGSLYQVAKVLESLYSTVFKWQN